MSFGAVSGPLNVASAIGLLLFALAAHQAGLQPVVLGADMPIHGLATAAVRARCEAIVLAGSVEPEPDVMAERLARLVEDTDLPVFVGGTASVRSCDAIIRAGAEALGSDLGQGVKRLSALLDDEKENTEKT